MSTVLGISLGSSDSFVGFIQKGTVDIVRNEISERKTPTVVGFTHENRLTGDNAVAKIKSNLKNTVRYMKMVIGGDAEVIKRELPFELAEMTQVEEGRDIGYTVSYLGTDKVFSATEVTAMFLTKLVDLAKSFTGISAKDVVIGVPSFYSTRQRELLVDACKIANINLLSLISENTAIGLQYGIYRNLEFQEPAKEGEEAATAAESKTGHNVLFMHSGHSYTELTLAQYFRGEFRVLASKSTVAVSGRAIEKVLVDQCVSEFCKKNKMNRSDLPKKSILKLEESVAKAKKVLSANSEAAVNVECLFEDRDISVLFKREDLEAACAPLEAELKSLVVSLLQESGVGLTLTCVEVTGGSSRVPFIQNALRTALDSLQISLPLSKTLNADECVARGATLFAAILSPLFKVREFKIHDGIQKPVVVSWLSDESGEQKSLEVFGLDSKLGQSKLMSFSRKSETPLKLAITSGNEHVATYDVEIPASLFTGCASGIKVKAKISLNTSNLLTVDSAHALIEEEYEEEVVVQKPAETATPSPTPAEEAAAGDDAAPAPAPPVTEKVKKTRTRKVELKVHRSFSLGLPHDRVIALSNAEGEMLITDHQIKLRDIARNDLESYVLGAKNKMIDDENIIKELESVEDWIYDNYEQPQAAFVDKLADLKNKFGPLNVVVSEPVTSAEDSSKQDEPMDIEQ
jgi:heat shock 70kDa protein 4